MKTRFLLPIACLAAVALSTTSGNAAGPAKGGHMSAPASTRAVPAARFAPATGATRFHHRNRIVIVNEFGVPFFPFWYPYWYGYYPYGYYPYAYYHSNSPAYGAGSIVIEVQRNLARTGYYHGPIDGVAGPRTRAAIRAYERAHGLRVDGMISERLMATMGLRG